MFVSQWQVRTLYPFLSDQNDFLTGMIIKSFLSDQNDFPTGMIIKSLLGLSNQNKARTLVLKIEILIKQTSEIRHSSIGAHLQILRNKFKTFRQLASTSYLRGCMH